MGTYTENNREIEYKPCIECGCDSIVLYKGDGYSTNVGVECEDCKNPVDSRYLVEHFKTNDITDGLINNWNYYNDPIKVIDKLENDIKKFKTKIEKYKKRLPKLKVNLEHNLILTCSNCNHDNQEYINKTSFVNYGHKDVPSYMWDYIRKCDCCGEKLDINIYVFLSDEYTLDKTVVGGKGFDVGKLKEFLSDKLITI